jgi:hypothetical protein
MAKRKRDYRAEYKRRLERAKAKGYSKDVARGHPKKGRAGIRAANFLRIPVGSSIGLEERDTRGRVKIVVDDARKRFGRRPKRKRGETIADYEERLIEMQRRRGSRFEWTDEFDFIRSMTELGLTERDAYTHWFSS